MLLLSSLSSSLPFFVFRCASASAPRDPSAAAWAILQRWQHRPNAHACARAGQQSGRQRCFRTSK
eukprot:12720969-Alexandrium_andersonii.AAC.1